MITPTATPITLAFVHECFALTVQFVKHASWKCIVNFT
jgi:hypothetical protein